MAADGASVDNVEHSSETVCDSPDCTGLLVIPAYRESVRLPGFLEDLAGRADAEGAALRIRVVDDGSGSVEQERIRELCVRMGRRFRCLLPPLLLKSNRGKGGAIRAGWKAGWKAHATPPAWYGFVDADGACCPRETLRLARMVRTDGPALFAARVKMLGKTVERSLARHLAGRVFATLVSSALRIPVYDSQCGLKFLPAPVYDAVGPRLSTDNFAFDVDLLACILATGHSVKEVPIDWRDRPGGKAGVLRNAWPMARETLRIGGKFRNAASLQPARLLNRHPL